MSAASPEEFGGVVVLSPYKAQVQFRPILYSTCPLGGSNV